MTNGSCLVNQRGRKGASRVQGGRIVVVAENESRAKGAMRAFDNAAWMHAPEAPPALTRCT
jgi:hypothetical protein